MSSIDKIRVNNIDYDIGINEIYSTTEQRIGTWIDGKPLYNRVFVKNETINNNATVTMGTIANLDKLINAYGVWKTLYFQGTIPYATSGQVKSVYAENNDIKLWTANEIKDGVIIVAEYTKTTDPEPSL